MFEIPTQEQWKDIFSISKELLDKAPWETIPEELIFKCNTDFSEESFYITVHGFEEEVCGISVYGGKQDIGRYLNILDAGDDASFQTIIANQSCVTVIYGEEFHLSPGDVTAMNQGGYIPDGSPHSFIYFRNYQPGMAPWYAGSKDIELLLAGLCLFRKVLEHMPETLPDAAKSMVSCNEDNIEIIDFDESLRVPLPDIVKDDLYIQRLKQLKKNAKVIEIDACYLPNPVAGQLSEVPLFPRFCIIADADEGFIADQCIFDETTEEEEAFFLFLSNYFNKNGLPRKIRIKKENTGYLLHNLCKRLHIELDERKTLPIVDDFMTMINGITPGE